MTDFFDIQDAPYAVETAFPSEPERLITFAEYIESEEFGTEKHEFHNGKLYTIKGGTDKHAEILANFATAINNALFINDDGSTHVYSSDMRIRINAVNKGTYPDVTVLKGEPEYYLNAPQIILNPTLIVEVLSKSTQKYDKGLKFDHYKTLESFREYVLVAQDSPSVEVHFLKNRAENLWEVTTYEGLANDVTLQSIGCTVKMKQIYHRIFK